MLAKLVFGNLPVPGDRFLETIAWEPLPGNLAWEHFPGNLLGTLLGNLFLGTLLGNLLTSSGEPCLGEPLGSLAWEPVPGNLAWETVPGNLGTLAWDVLGKGDPFPGTWFPTLRGADLAAPNCSGTFTNGGRPQAYAVGE